MATKRLTAKRNATPEMSEEEKTTRQAIQTFDYTPKGLKGTYNDWNSRVNQYFQRDVPKRDPGNVGRQMASERAKPFLEPTPAKPVQRAPGSNARALMPTSKPQTSGIQDVNGGKWKGSFFYGEEE